MGKFFETCFVWALYAFFTICIIIALLCTIAIMPLAILTYAAFCVLTLPIELFRMAKRSWRK